MQPDEWAAADPSGRSFVNVNTPEEFAALAESSEAPSA
jgi:molybdopterin-guanine dinucleotide biosynthesis protein A